VARFLLFLGLAAGLYILFRWLSRQPTRVYWQLLAVGFALVLLLLVLSGRAHWLAAVFAALLPFARFVLSQFGNLPFLKRVLAGMGAARPGARPSAGQTSTVQAKYLRMTLNHDSGDISGEVLAGQFKGKTLDQLDLEALLRLLGECGDDEESVALLEAYLDRVYADGWKRQAGEERRETPGSSAEMSREEALQVLGLESGASREQIIEAHRRLMQKLHPDRGGSAYLAARINLAKQILLDD
jgi:hypothetical protein